MGNHHHDHDHGADHEARCEEALAELYTFLDGELTDERRSTIRHHLDDCNPCLEVFDFEAELRIVIRQRCTEQVPESLRAKVAARLDELGLSGDSTQAGRLPSQRSGEALAGPDQRP